MTLYDESLRPLLGAPVTQVVVNAVGREPVTVDMFNTPNAYLGAVTLKTPHLVGCSDLSGISRRFGRTCHGIIGMRFLRNFILKIDFRKRGQSA